MDSEDSKFSKLPQDDSQYTCACVYATELWLSLIKEPTDRWEVGVWYEIDKDWKLGSATL